MPGFRTHPLADIQRIRQDLRDRYKGGFPILKELLQNADDAGADRPGASAKRCVLTLAETGIPGASHPLMNTSGLAILNDGDFTASDANSITSFGLSNRASDAQFAGRFGLGLKSVFHWAEAFFYFSPNHFEGNGQSSASDLLNPWWSRYEKIGLHEDWDSKWTETKGVDLPAFQRLAERALNAGRWFGIWIPFRRLIHLEGVKPIEAREPSADFADLFGNDWFTRLAGVLPMLRRIEEVRVCKLLGAETVEEGWVRIAAACERMRFGVQAGNGEPSGAQVIRGTVETSNESATVQFEGRETLSAIVPMGLWRHHRFWPSQVGIGAHGEPQPAFEKTVPHGAIVLGRQVAQEEHILEIQHAVFLPLGQPEAGHKPEHWGEPEVVPCRAGARYRLFLHGYFFVDSGRQYIERIDELEDDADLEKVKDESELRQLWNRTLLREVVAPLLLPTLTAFVGEQRLSASDTLELVKALAESMTYREHYRKWACHGYRYIYRLGQEGAAWTLVPVDLPLVGLPRPAFPEQELFERFPGFKAFCVVNALVFRDTPCLSAEKADRLSDEQSALLLPGDGQELFADVDSVEYLLELLPPEVAKADQGSILAKALVRLSSSLLGRSLPKNGVLRKNWREFFSRLPSSCVITVPCTSEDVADELPQALAGAEIPVALLWQDFRDDEGRLYRVSRVIWN